MCSWAWGAATATSFPLNDDAWACKWKKDPGGNSCALEAHVVCLVPEGTPPLDAGL